LVNLTILDILGYHMTTQLCNRRVTGITNSDTNSICHHGDFSNSP